MLGLSPDQMGHLFDLMRLASEMLLVATLVWLSQHRYTLRGLLKRARCHL